VQPDERLERVRVLRERGQTPKQIARALGIRPAEAGRLVRAAATTRKARRDQQRRSAMPPRPGPAAGVAPPPAHDTADLEAKPFEVIE